MLQFKRVYSVRMRFANRRYSIRNSQSAIENVAARMSAYAGQAAQQAHRHGLHDVHGEHGAAPGPQAPQHGHRLHPALDEDVHRAGHPEPAQEAIRRLRDAGCIIRSQAPLIRHVNDSSQAWAEMW